MDEALATEEVEDSNNFQPAGLPGKTGRAGRLPSAEVPYANAHTHITSTWPHSDAYPYQHTVRN